jgi:hypothetical protein
MTNIRFAKFLALPALLAGAALAHHTTALFNAAEPVQLAGTVESFAWGNPHSWIKISVPGANGNATEWLIECNSIPLLKRFGWTSTSVRPGDRITVSIAPDFDGFKRGEALSVTTAAGVKLNNAMVESGG